MVRRSRFGTVAAVVILLCLLVSQPSDAKRRGKGKKNQQQPEEKPRLEVENDSPQIVQELPSSEGVGEEPKEQETESGDEDSNGIHPCSELHCGAGRECILGPERTPSCECIRECPQEVDPRRKVCSNKNVTWESDCHLYQMRCWCKEKEERCTDETTVHAHVEYYGICQEMPKCKGEEMEDFPHRMREWLFNVMRELADRKQLSDYYKLMEREAEVDLNKKWINAAIWKWCDLDGNPHDRKISRHELFPIRAPLMSLEHCIAPFLDSCDEDNDHFIHLTEWGRCLQLKPNELEERCEQIQDD